MVSKETGRDIVIPAIIEWKIEARRRSTDVGESNLVCFGKVQTWRLAIFVIINSCGYEVR